MKLPKKRDVHHPLADLSPLPSTEARSLRKATELFEARGVRRFLMASALPPVERQRLALQLIALQASIFGLDYYGEEHWDLDQSRLDIHWASILSAASLISSFAIGTEIFSDLLTYQELEIATRRGIPVVGSDIDPFYRLKNSDVRLSRLAIAATVASYAERPTLAAWEALDIVGEVADDLDDLSEDFGTPNGNRILSSLSLHGVSVTTEEYCDFLQGIQAAASSEARNAAAGLYQPECGDKSIWIEVAHNASNLIRRFRTRLTRQLATEQWSVSWLRPRHPVRIFMPGALAPPILPAPTHGASQG